jgi:hypothetical protein
MPPDAETPDDRPPRRQYEEPPRIRRSLVWFTLAWLSVIVGAITLYGLAEGLPRRYGSLTRQAEGHLFLIISLIPICITRQLLFFRGVKRSVRLTRGAVCWKCLSRLDAGPAQGECRSCGATYDRAELAQRWDAYLNPCPEPEPPPIVTHCKRCGYCLDGLPAHGLCPECGREYEKRPGC